MNSKPFNPKLIFVMGGVMSGLGKGITTASLGRLLISKGFDVTCIKIDPYLNADAGTMRPTEHGEIFVTEDGGEIDQDLGNYERFLHKTLSKKNNITTGQIYSTVLEKERCGEYLGKTVQIIPHIVEEVKRRILDLAKGHEITLVEVGGTVGDYEIPIYLEAARQLRLKLGAESVLFFFLTYLPTLETLGEPKTKPTQHSARMLMEAGIIPDFIVCRSCEKVDDVRKEKIGLFCNVEKDCVISNPDIGCIYEVPLIFNTQNVGEKMLHKLKLEDRGNLLYAWTRIVEKFKCGGKQLKIGLVGKYVHSGAFTLADSYASVNEAIKHACAELGARPAIQWIDSGLFEKDPQSLKILEDYAGIVVPGGFGTSGAEGKIDAIKYCREKDIPFLGLCLGLQLSVVETARNVCGLAGAHTTEINSETKHPVVDLLPEQKSITAKGATMRLGAYPAVLAEKTKALALYEKFSRVQNENTVTERHRHRYEVNPEYHAQLKKEICFSGMSPDGRLVEFIELEKHPFFLATQAHPEFTSWPGVPNPLFYGFIEAAME